VANPFTSARAPETSPAMQILAPELAAEQIRNARFQQLAQLLRDQGMQSDGGTQVINGWAVKKSPMEGLSKIGQLLIGTLIQKNLDDKNAELNKNFADKLRSTASGYGGVVDPSSGMTMNGVPAARLGGGLSHDQGAMLMANQLLYGDKAADVIKDQLIMAPAVKEAMQLGISPEQMRENYLAESRVKGTQTLPAGQLAILPNGQKMVAPDFNSGVAGGFDINGNPVVRQIPGATEALAAKEGALSAAREGAKLLPLDYVDQGGRPLGMTQGEFLGGSANNTSYQAADQKFGFPPGTMEAIARVESNNNPNAVSPKGAQGIFQIMPATQRNPGFGLQQLNPNSAEDAGSYLAKMRDLSGGDLQQAIAKYNAGPAGNLNNPETTNYVNKVLSNINQSTGRPTIQSATEKQAAIDAQKLASEPKLIKANEDAKIASEREAGLANQVSKSTDLMKRIKVTEDALNEFRTGGGTEVRSKVAEIAQALGMPQEYVDKVAGGDLGAMQVVKKTALQESLLQMQQALASDSGAQQRGNQMIMEEFMKSNPHLDTDPRAFEKLLNMMKDHHRALLEQSNEYYKYKSEGKDLSAWPNYWAQKGLNEGKVKADTKNKYPYASQKNSAPEPFRGQMTPEVWAKMKSGDTFVDAQGNVRRKP
jgi:hypothetical protein